MSRDFEEELKELLLDFDDFDEYNACDDVNISVPMGLCKKLVDIVFCIDVTSSMATIFNKIKTFLLDLSNNVFADTFGMGRCLKQLRVKVIAFRDYYYCDGQFAMAESQFYSLPKETAAFSEYVLGLKADGGGDEPENALEAIALAMKSDWVHAISTNEKARNIIVVFTDAAAHPLEKSAEVISEYYPTDMLKSYSQLVDAWQGSGSLGYDRMEKYRMNPRVKRMIVYAPYNMYPWNELEFDLEMMIMRNIEDLTPEEISSDIKSAIV